MLRFIIKRRVLDRMSGLESSGLETVDAECPALEAVLLGGGTDQSAYDHRSVEGVEILPTVPDAAPLLRRASKLIDAWGAAYGDHRPDWLPPPGEVDLQEDIDNYLLAVGSKKEAPNA